MFLKQINLSHFRNYVNQKNIFENKINIILGNNAQGKTNLLESIYFLGMGKSHRTSNDKELIHYDKEFAKIDGIIQYKNHVIDLELMILQQGKKAKINKIEEKKMSNFIGNFKLVMFAPEDLEIIKGSPLQRRKFLDMEIGQISSVYLFNLHQYQKIIQQKNHYLKLFQQKKMYDEKLLDIYNQQLIPLIIEITNKRFYFIEKLVKIIDPIHRSITENKEQIDIKYVSTSDFLSEYTNDKKVQILEEKFDKIKKKEFEIGTSLFGPHRDDVDFFLNGKKAQSYGSQGQQRTTALVLKLAEIELIFNESGEYPVLLLDDVFSELDFQRQSLLLQTIDGNVQTFLSTTSVDGIHPHVIEKAALFKVQEGKMSEL